ncbi:MAG TPA: hypothetical protein IAB50_04485 [Candidatus Faecivicinus avistercoris]|nr:hypothetical protein [Candidatus Faecivicinus avistercoris]
MAAMVESSCIFALLDLLDSDNLDEKQLPAKIPQKGEARSGVFERKAPFRADFPSILAEECPSLSEAGNSRRQTRTESLDALRNLHARKCAEFETGQSATACASSTPRTRRFWAQTLRLSSVQESRFPNLFSGSPPGTAGSHFILADFGKKPSALEKNRSPKAHFA